MTVWTYILVGIAVFAMFSISGAISRMANAIDRLVDLYDEPKDDQGNGG